MARVTFVLPALRRRCGLVLLRRIGHYGHPVLRDRRRPASGPSLAGGVHARRGYANDNHLLQGKEET